MVNQKIWPELKLNNMKTNLNWYILRYLMFWVDLFTAIANIISFGFWQPNWDMKMENIFLDYTDKINLKNNHE